jgi:hypothetical protein
MSERLLGQKIITSQGVIRTKLQHKNGYYSIIKQLERMDGVVKKPVLEIVGEINLSPDEMEELIQFVEQVRKTEPKYCCGL